MKRESDTSVCVCVREREGGECMFVYMREWGYERKDRVSESACMCERLSFLNQHERQLVSGCGFMHECVGERERERERDTGKM